MAPEKKHARVRLLALLALVLLSWLPLLACAQTLRGMGWNSARDRAESIASAQRRPAR